MAKNQIKLILESRSENVGISRVTAAAFSAQAEFTLPEIEEIKVAISEAVSNSVIHGYGDSPGIIEFEMILHEDYLEYIITDWGRGIADVALAKQPAYSTQPDRMGLGFVFMESFMDEVEVISALNKGTTVRLVKKIDTKSVH